MIDVRNSHRKWLRTNSAIKGFRAEDGMNQDVFLTWYRWGFDRKGDTTEVEFMDLYHKEWDRVEKSNMERYGRLDPWRKVGGSYALQEGLK